MQYQDLMGQDRPATTPCQAGVGETLAMQAHKIKGCPNCERRIHFGDPAVEILKIIDLEAIDLVVMGTHGYRGLEQYLGVSPIKW